jgi:hypothetical protein
MSDTIAARIHGAIGLIAIAKHAFDNSDPRDVAMAEEAERALAEARKTLEGALDEIRPGWRLH